MIVPVRLEPVTRQMIERAIRPPSSGYAGIRLKTSNSTFIGSSQLSDSSTGVIVMSSSSAIAWVNRCGPTIATSIARQTRITPSVASGPAAETLKSSPGVAASRFIRVSPPNRYRSI